MTQQAGPNVHPNALPPPPAGASRLVVEPTERERLTARRETDTRVAVTRGMREYLEQLSLWWGGKTLRFATVVEAWAEPEQTATYPAAIVHAVGDAHPDREQARLTPRVVVLDDGQAAGIVAEFTSAVTVEAWATDPRERAGLAAMLEDAFAPVAWMSGFRLELPHYHGVRSTWEVTGTRYVDTAEDAQRRLRRVQVDLMVAVPQVRVYGKLPAMQVRARVEP